MTEGKMIPIVTSCKYQNERQQGGRCLNKEECISVFYIQGNESHEDFNEWVDKDQKTSDEAFEQDLKVNLGLRESREHVSATIQAAL